MVYHNTDFEMQEKEINCAFEDTIQKLQVSRILKQILVYWEKFISLLSFRIIAYFDTLTHTEQIKCCSL